MSTLKVNLMLYNRLMMSQIGIQTNSNDDDEIVTGSENRIEE